MNIFALSGVLIMASSGLMALVMFALGRTRTHTLWGVFCLSVFTWGLGAFMIGSTADPRVADFWWRVTHIGIIFIPVLFLHFVYVFLEQKRNWTLFLFYAIGIFFAGATIYGDLMIADMRFVFDEFYYDSPPGLLYPLFTTFFFGSVIYSHVVLWRAFKRSTDELLRTRIQYFFVAMGLSFAGGSMSFLPVYGVDVYPILNLAVFIYPVVVGYSIFKHKLFDIRVVAAQLAVYLLWMFLLIRFAFSDSQNELLLNGGLLIATVAIGIILIRSVMKEVAAREEVERLAQKLQHANERLQELDRLKSEFLSIASHQLRSPLTSVKGYASMILEGSFGKVPDSIREAVERIYEASEGMAASVEDYLNVSRIEQGRMQYDYTEVDIGELAAHVVDEQMPEAKNKGVALVYEKPGSSLIARVDENKVRQIFTNLVDNAIKYTPEGEAIVSVTAVDGRVRFSVRDTGVGIDPDTLDGLFERFVRAKNANKVNVTGTGLGLYVARKMVEAMGGKIWAESAGEGKGSTFIVEFPRTQASG